MRGLGARQRGPLRVGRAVIGPIYLIGLFIYQLVVLPIGGFSGWAGVARAGHHRHPGGGPHHEDMLQLIPTRCARR
jgi:hypothetical protein